MIKNSKFVKTAIAAAALGFAAFGAQASVSATPTVYAQELFLGSSPGTGVRTPAINIVSPVALPIGSTVTVIVKLANAKFLDVTAATTATGATVTSTTRFNSSSAAAVTAVGVIDSTANADSVMIVLTTTTGALGVGGTLMTLPAHGTTSNLSAPGLATVGTTVTATSTIYAGALAGTPTFGTPVAEMVLEATSTPATLLTSRKALAVSIAAAATDQRIAIPSLTVMTAGAAPTGSGAAARVRIANITSTVITANTRSLDPAVDYASGTSTLTLTAPAGYFGFLTGTTPGSINVYARANATDAACLGGPIGTFAAVTTPTTATTATMAATAIAPAAFPYEVCLTPGTGGTLSAITTGVAQLAMTVGATAAQNVATVVAATDTSALIVNGSAKTTSAYWPGAWASIGYAGFTRVTNSGTLPALVTFAYINPTTGVTSPTFTVPSVGTAGTLAGGASAMIANTAIETAGVAAGVTFVQANGRLLITAPTESLSVQNYVQTNGAAPQETSGAN